MERSQILIKN